MSDLTAIAASMVRLEGGCEKGHRAGQWHMHEEAVIALGRRVAAAARAGVPAEPLDLGPRCRGESPDGPCDDETCEAHARPDEPGDLAAALRDRIIRAVAETHGYPNPNTAPGSWWAHKAQPVLDLFRALSRPAPEPLDVERLARAMYQLAYREPIERSSMPPAIATAYREDYAPELAREYAALATTEPSHQEDIRDVADLEADRENP